MIESRRGVIDRARSARRGEDARVARRGEGAWVARRGEGARGADVLIVDRYEIGERATSAC
ncbi:hypothetical protein OJ997_31400, partial [Solirubrobacter phytolaccae]